MLRSLALVLLTQMWALTVQAQEPLLVTDRPWAVAGERLTGVLLGADSVQRVELLDSLGQRLVLIDSVRDEFELALPVALPTGYYRLRVLSSQGTTITGIERVIYCFALGTAVPPVLEPPRLAPPDVEALQAWPPAGDVAPDDSLLITVADPAQREGYAFTLNSPLGEVPLRQLAPGVWQARVLAQVYASVRLRARAAGAERSWTWSARPTARWGLRLRHATASEQRWLVSGPQGTSVTLVKGTSSQPVSLDQEGRAELSLPLTALPYGPSRLWLVSGSDTVAAAWAWRPLATATEADTLGRAAIRYGGPAPLDVSAVLITSQTGAPEALVGALAEATGGDSLLALHELMAIGASQSTGPRRPSASLAEPIAPFQVRLSTNEGAPLSGTPIVGIIEGPTPRLLQGLSDGQGLWTPPAEALSGGRQLRLAALSAPAGAKLTVSGGVPLVPTAALSPAIAYQHWRLLTAYRATHHASVVRQALLNAWLAQPDAARSAELNQLLGRARLEGLRFFEAADDSVRFTEFYTLPNMTEMAQNYLLPLSYVTRKGQRVVRLLAERPKQRYLHSGEPLLVVDGQPMPSFDAFEQLKPGLLERAYLLRNPTTLVPFGRAGFNGLVVLQSLVGHDQGFAKGGPIARVVLPQPAKLNAPLALKQRIAAVSVQALPTLLPEANHSTIVWRRPDGNWVVRSTR